MIGTSAELRQNTWVFLHDLLYGAMLPSGNDAAYLLSEVVGYLIKNTEFDFREIKHLDLTNQNTINYRVEFIRLMNKKSEELKLMSTKFSNPHGLQNAMNTSSPKDLISLSRYASNNCYFRKIMNSDSYRYKFLEEEKNLPPNLSTEEILASKTKTSSKRWWNTNLLLKKGWEGVKTGQTGSAGSCLSSLKNGIFIVLLNCKNNDARFSETEKLYEWYSAMKLKDSTDDEDPE